MCVYSHRPTLAVVPSPSHKSRLSSKKHPSRVRHHPHARPRVSPPPPSPRAQSGSPPSVLPAPASHFRRSSSQVSNGASVAQVFPTHTFDGVGTASAGTARSMHALTTALAVVTASTESSHSNRSSSCICATNRTGTFEAADATSRCSEVVGSIPAGDAAASQRHIAIFIKSAALPWISEFTALRSDSARSAWSAARIPGRGRCRPLGSTTIRSHLARSLVRDTNVRTPGNARKNALIKPCATSPVHPSFSARPVLPCPYSSPYTVLLALSRSSLLTGVSGEVPRPAFHMRSKTSPPSVICLRSNDMSPVSAERCASIRSSIWE
mmetsp:Transcript_8464/g.38496  ORF Transcript_8464/g.38496 Transcript_8464/m.38496 type:complete len:324 (+) Transcript_8464:4066-5037(+)